MASTADQAGPSTSSATKRPASPIPADLPTPSVKKPVVKWHTLHCDPIQDVVLVSRDKIYFRASSHALKRESTFFQGMLTSIPNPYQTETNAIPLDFSSAAIALFLDFYSTSSLPPLSEFSVRQLHDLRKLVQYLDCDRLIHGVRTAYMTACTTKPVEWLIVASHDNDLLAAKAALLRCHANGVPINADNYWETVERLRLSWQLPMLYILLNPAKCGFHDDHLAVSWPNAAHIEVLIKDLKVTTKREEGAMRE